jgi:DNA-nicking Smr family endonuclease
MPPDTVDRPLRPPAASAPAAPAKPAVPGAPAPVPTGHRAPVRSARAGEPLAHPHPAPGPPVSRRAPELAPQLAPVAEASGHRRVRRGQLDLAGRIDLHGLTQRAAEAALASFITHHRRLGARAVLVVTGKGVPVDPAEDYLVPQPGVIRRRLPEWLSSPAIRPHVSGYSEANARHGGSGAFYVLLKAL